MAYELRSKKGHQIKKEDIPIFISDVSSKSELIDLDEKNKSFTAVASTEDIDRDGDIIIQSGWDLKNFKKNPVLPWSHNYFAVPIGKSLKTWVDKGSNKLMFKPKFDENDEEAMKVFQKYVDGFLTSFSVGFAPKDWEWIDEDAGWYSGRKYLKQDLLEISFVAVPSNPNANIRLSFDGSDDDMPGKNMLQMGYPEVFAKTKFGLFYPIRDIALFSDPEEIKVSDGIIGIKAICLDENLSVDTPIAYIFDSQKFTDELVNKWINDNVQKTWKTKYYNFDIDQGTFDVDMVEEDSTIKIFETSIEFTDNNNVDSIDNVKDKTIFEENNIDAEDKEKNTTVENNEELEKLNICRIVEIITNIKDLTGKVIISETKIIGIKEELNTIEEYQKFAKQEDDLLKNEISNIKLLIDNLTGSIQALTDERKEDKSTTDTDDTFELDDSLTISPNNDNSKSDEIIEVDNDLLESSKSEIQEVAKNSLLDILKENIIEAFSNASGKIE